MSDKTTGRHHQWSATDTGERPDGYTRKKTCGTCGMQADRFGNGRTSYWLYYRNNELVHDSSHGGSAPPCEPRSDTQPPAAAEAPYAYSTCAFCKRTIQQATPGAPWGLKKIGTPGYDSECPQAPNPDDGPMPSHRPGTPVVTNPEWEFGR